MNWFIFLIIVILIVMVVIFIRINKIIKLVKENSEKFKKLVKLNSNYNFNKNVKKHIEIIHFVKSKTDLSKINLKHLIVDLFKDNTNNILLNTKSIIENENKYELYIKKYNLIDDVTSSEVISLINMKTSTFNFIEKKLFSKYKLKPVIKTKVSLIAKFDTPKNESKYQKSDIFKYKELKNIMKDIKKITESEE